MILDVWMERNNETIEQLRTIGPVFYAGIACEEYGQVLPEKTTGWFVQDEPSECDCVAEINSILVQRAEMTNPLSIEVERKGPSIN